MFGLIVLIAFRRALFLLVRRWTREGRLDRRTVVVGAGGSGESLIEKLAAQRNSDVRVIGVFDDRGDDRASATCSGVPKLGTVDDLVEFARSTRVDLVIFSLPISAERRILQMLKKLWVLPLDIRLAAHTNKLRFRPRAYSYRCSTFSTGRSPGRRRSLECARQPPASARKPTPLAAEKHSSSLTPPAAVGVPVIR